MNRYFKIVFSFGTHYSEIDKLEFTFDNDEDSVKNHLIGAEPFDEEDLDELKSITEITKEEYDSVDKTADGII